VEVPAATRALFVECHPRRARARTVGLASRCAQPELGEHVYGAGMASAFGIPMRGYIYSRVQATTSSRVKEARRMRTLAAPLDRAEANRCTLIRVWAFVPERLQGSTRRRSLSLSSAGRTPSNPAWLTSRCIQDGGSPAASLGPTGASLPKRNMAGAAGCRPTRSVPDAGIRPHDTVRPVYDDVRSSSDFQESRPVAGGGGTASGPADRRAAQRPLQRCFRET
jgi:hypothetical protein